MREVGAFEAKNTLGTLLDCVQRGEEVVITRHGRPVARLVPEPELSADRRTRARQAAADLKAMSRGLQLDGLAIRTLINEGRR